MFLASDHSEDMIILLTYFSSQFLSLIPVIAILNGVGTQIRELLTTEQLSAEIVDLLSSTRVNYPHTVADFSGRGPAADGRTKPDIVAVGDKVVSAKSNGAASGNAASPGCDAAKTSDTLLTLSGTSMSTPAVAGSVTVLRQFLRQRLGHAAPSSALLKGLLVLSAGPVKYTQYLSNKIEVNER